MFDLKKFTRILLIGLGIYLLIQILSSLFFYIMSIFSGTVLSMLMLLPYLIVIYFLLFKNKYLTDKIYAKIEIDPQITVSWQYTAFRLTCVLMGLYFLPKTIYDIIEQLSYMIPYSWNSENYHYQSQINAHTIIYLVIKTALTIYLLYGAPHLVKWHLKKSAELAKLLEENQQNAESKNI